MKTSPYISFAGATENRRLPLKDVKPPQFTRVEGFYPDTSDKLLTAPIPSYSFPAAATIPSSPARDRIESDILVLGAGGIGYTEGTSNVSVSGAGSGADLYLYVNGVGSITSVGVYTSGTGYASATPPTVALSGGTSGSITVEHWLLNDYTSWIEIGAYVVLLGATGHTRRIRWCAPGRNTVWDQFEMDGDIEVLTGAGYVDLPGTGALESGVTIGSMAVLFDATGIGALTLTGDWEAPFAYAKTLNETTAESDTRLLNQVAEFCGYDGRIWRTNGYSITPFDGPMDLNKVSGVTWPPASSGTQFAFDTSTQCYVIHPYHASGSGVNIWVDRETGAYTADDLSDSTKYATTGAIQLEGEDQRVHIQRVRVFTQITGTYSNYCTVTVGIKGIHESSWHTSSSYNIGTAATAGEYETDVEVNYICKQPQLKITVTTQTGATLKLQGIVMIYDTGGFR